jgi:hypothetical protein
MEIVPIDPSNLEHKKVADCYNEIVRNLPVMQRVELQRLVDEGGMGKGLEYLADLVMPTTPKPAASTDVECVPQSKEPNVR